tara:strand:- start:257 stop:1036 length:780 start_codon:yes stop_codon:yes gene_type:complete
MQPLKLDVTGFNVPQGLSTHIKYALSLGLPEFNPALCSHDGTFVIAGAGPSLASTLDELREEREKGRPICAVKAAHDFLIKNGIEPDLFLSIDPRDRRNNVQEKTENTIYLMASRCAPEMFDHLKGRKVMLFHAACVEEEHQALGKDAFLVGGTSTSGLRAINVGYIMGYRKFVLYGMDSCNAKDGITKRVDGSLTGQTIDVYVGGPSGRKFVCNVAMAEQANSFQQVWQMMPDAKLEIKGDGLLAAIVDERKRTGQWT